MKKTFKLSDSVIARIAQIIQEAILTGTDCVDHLRMIELVKVNSGNELDLSEEYRQLVEKQHETMLRELQEKMAQQMQVQQDKELEGKTIFRLDNQFGIAVMDDDK